MADIKKPRSGSLGFYPRKRAKRIYPRIARVSGEKVGTLAFAGYKAAMVSVVMIDNRKGSRNFGQIIVKPATVIDCPPLKILGYRAYSTTANGMRAIGEVWDDKKFAKDKDLARKINTKNLGKQNKQQLEKIEKEIEKANVSNVRLIVCTQPRQSGVGKKTPEIFELEIGGKTAKEKLEFAKQHIGSEVKVTDFAKEGELVDVIAITKGKGTQGPVKRFGVKIQGRKAAQKQRHVGAIAPQSPRRVMWTVAMAGQLGFGRRTELNKRILKVGDNGSEITPKSGFTRYGLIKGSYVVVEGSTPGPKKRLVFLRHAVRPSKVKLLVPEIKQIISE
jgi:large subunit ribosomal protein L3